MPRKKKLTHGTGANATSANAPHSSSSSSEAQDGVANPMMQLMQMLGGLGEGGADGLAQMLGGLGGGGGFAPADRGTSGQGQNLDGESGDDEERAGEEEEQNVDCGFSYRDDPVLPKIKISRTSVKTHMEQFGGVHMLSAVCRVWEGRFVSLTTHH